MSYNIYTVGN